MKKCFARPLSTQNEFLAENNIFIWFLFSLWNAELERCESHIDDDTPLFLAKLNPYETFSFG